MPDSLSLKAERDFSGVDWNGANLAGANLVDVMFDDANSRSPPYLGYLSISAIATVIVLYILKVGLKIFCDYTEPTVDSDTSAAKKEKAG